MAQERSLNLDELLGEEYVRHYLRFIDGGGDRFYVNGEGAAITGSMGVAVTADDQYSLDDEREPVREVLRRRGSGPDVCSSSAELLPHPLVCWDVCGYYRRLGVHWKATRRELREAWASGDMGDRRRTYAFAQLWNREMRAMYDQMELGGLFLPDQDVQDWLKAQAAKIAMRARAAGGDTTTDDVLDEMGLRYDSKLRTGEDVLRSARELPEAEPETGDRSGILGNSISHWNRDWSYWHEGGRPDTSQLGQWQLLLAAAFRDAGSPFRFAVGLTRQPGFVISSRLSEGAPIILLGTEPPTPELAARAVQAFMAR